MGNCCSLFSRRQQTGDEKNSHTLFLEQTVPFLRFVAPVVQHATRQKDEEILSCGPFGSAREGQHETFHSPEALPPGRHPSYRRRELSSPTTCSDCGEPLLIVPVDASEPGDEGELYAAAYPYSPSVQSPFFGAANLEPSSPALNIQKERFYGFCRNEQRVRNRLVPRSEERENGCAYTAKVPSWKDIGICGTADKDGILRSAWRVVESMDDTDHRILRHHFDGRRY